MRVGTRTGSRWTQCCGQPTAGCTGLRLAAPRSPHRVHRSPVSPGGDRRSKAGRHRPTGSRVGAAVDARLPAARRTSMRGARPRPRFRGGRLPGITGQASRRYPLPTPASICRRCCGDRRLQSLMTTVAIGNGATENCWLPRASCSSECTRSGHASPGRRAVVAVRVTARGALMMMLLLLVLPLLAVPLPGRSHLQRSCCRLVLRSLGVRITLSGAPIRNVPGVLVVSGHVSWVDIFVIGAVLPGSFVAKSEMVDWPGLVHHRPCRGPVVAAAGYRPSRTGCPLRGRRAWRRIAVDAGDAFRLRWRPCAGGVSAVGSDGARRLL